MDTKKITVEETKVWEAYNAGTTEMKKTLESIYGKEFFTKTIIDRIKTVEDIFSYLGKPLDPRDDCYHTDGENLAIRSHSTLLLLCRVLNEGWTPDWNNPNQPKWYPWFNMNAGFAFSGSYCALTSTHAFVGSRLCFKTKELSDYAGQQFIDLYKSMLTF